MMAAQSSSVPKMADADELIDAILAEKGPAKYTDGLSEENWEEELEQIPLFMTKPPDPSVIDKSPGLAALQEIKYQEETPEGRAGVLKEDGNIFFKEKKYKEAIDVYTQALAEKISDIDLTAVLYCNRSAAHYHIGNCRSSIADATQCKSVKPTHIKAYIRGAEATFKLEKYQETLDWCSEGLKIDPDCKKLTDMKKSATIEKKRKERDIRKNEIAAKKKEQEDSHLLEAIKLRGIRLASSPQEVAGGVSEGEDNDLLQLCGPHPSAPRVHIDEEGHLLWPVLFLYPEYGQTDLIESFHEYNKFSDHISVMFGEDERVSWDHESKYKPHRIEVWYEDYINGTYVQVPVQSTLADVINHSSRYVVIAGSPSFILLAADSRFQKQFVTNKCN